MRPLIEKQPRQAKTRKTVRAADAAPHWFRLSKYRFTWKLDAVGWAEQLMIRSAFVRAIEYGETPERKMRKTKRVDGAELHWEDTPESRAFVAVLEKGPQVSRSCFDEFPPEWKVRHPWLFMRENPDNVEAIHHLTREDLYILGSSFDLASSTYRDLVDEVAEIFPFNYPPEDEYDWSDTVQKRRYCLKQRRVRHILGLPDVNSAAPDLRFHVPYEPSLGQPAGGLGLQENEIPVLVDLDFPDDILVAYFKQFLKNVRASHMGHIFSDSPKKGRRPGLTDRRALASSALLPYLDLTLWAFVNGTRFSNETLGRLIFTRPRGPDSVRKNAAHYAVQLMDLQSDMSQQLRFLAVTMGSEQK